MQNVDMYVCQYSKQKYSLDYTDLDLTFDVLRQYLHSTTKNDTDIWQGSANLNQGTLGSIQCLKENHTGHMR